MLADIYQILYLPDHKDVLLILCYNCTETYTVLVSSHIVCPGHVMPKNAATIHARRQSSASHSYGFNCMLQAAG